MLPALKTAGGRSVRWNTTGIHTGGGARVRGAAMESPSAPHIPQGVRKSLINYVRIKPPVSRFMSPPFQIATRIYEHAHAYIVYM